MRLKDQVVLITGAASGMGRALALLVAREGGHVGLLDRQEASLKTLACQLEAEGRPCAWRTVDVCDRHGVAGAVQGLTEQLGPVDILVTAAGITGATLVDDLAVAETERILNVNVLGVANTIAAVLPDMLGRGQGQIVAIGSLAGCRGMPFSAAYSASKAALDRYLESMRPALRRRGVRVTTVLPGFVRTPLMEAALVKPPMAMMEPAKAAEYILHAILKRKRVYAFPLSTRLVLGFLSWMPAGIYDYLMAQGAAKVPDVTY